MLKARARRSSRAELVVGGPSSFTLSRAQPDGPQHALGRLLGGKRGLIDCSAVLFERNAVGREQCVGGHRSQVTVLRLPERLGGLALVLRARERPPRCHEKQHVCTSGTGHPRGALGRVEVKSTLGAARLHTRRMVHVALASRDVVALGDGGERRLGACRRR